MDKESKIVKKMGYNSYYIKKITSIKDLKKRRKYLFKLVCNYSKFHNIQCNIKSQYCKNIQYGGGGKSSKELLDILDKYIKNLEQREIKLSELHKIKIKTLHSENIIFEKNNKTLESDNTKFKNELQAMKLKLIGLEGEFKIKDNLSITRIKTLENIFIDFTIKQIIYLKSIFLYIYPEYNVYNDLNTLLTLMRTSSNFNATSIAEAKRNNERLDYLYPDNYSYLQDSIYSVNLAICDLFKKTGILLSSNITPIITKDKNLGWIDNDDNDKIVYYESGSFVNKDTKIAYTKISTKEIDIKNFDDISKHIIDFDESNDKLARIDLQKILIIIDEGLNILMNSCSCETMCTYQYEGKVAHWCKFPSKPTCARGQQGRMTAYSKNCNPLKNASNHVYMTEKSNKSKTKQYYIGSHPFASNTNEKNNKYCIYDTSNKKVILSNKKKCAFVKVTVQRLLENRNNDVHEEKLLELSKNIDNAVRTITTKKIG
jgi:hypothetical protein